MSERPVQYRGIDKNFEDQISLMYCFVFQKAETKPILGFKKPKPSLIFFTLQFALRFYSLEFKNCSQKKINFENKMYFRFQFFSIKKKNHGRPKNQSKSPGFPQIKRCKNIEFLEFSTHPCMPRECGKLPKIKVIQ